MPHYQGAFFLDTVRHTATRLASIGSFRSKAARVLGFRRQHHWEQYVAPNGSPLT